MNRIKIDSNRKITANFRSESTYTGDNDIQAILIQLPKEIDGAAVTEYEIELRAVFSDGDYVGFNIPTSNKEYKWSVPESVTAESGTVKILFYFTRGEAKGRSNSIDFIVNPIPDKGEQLQSRAEIDALIKGLRDEIAEKDATIERQQQRLAELENV